MGVRDLIITPLFLILLYSLAYVTRPLFTNKDTKPYFIPGLTLKFVGAIAVGLIYQFYYGYGGDTFAYFNLGSKYIWEAFLESPAIAFQLIFGENVYTSQNFQFANQIYSFPDSASYFVVRVAGIFDIITGHTYSATALLFATASYTGVWAMFVTFYRFYPQLKKQIALATLFIPSVFFWGSGVLKDSLTLGALGWLFYSLTHLTYGKGNLISNIFIILGASYVLLSIKIYILLCFVPAAALWLFYRYQASIKSAAVRLMTGPIIIGLGIVAAYFSIIQLSVDHYRYSTDNIIKTAQETAQWNYYVSNVQGGSGYTLGDYDFSTQGLITKFVPAVLTAFYRPIIWEARNPVMLLSALENLVILVLSFLIIFKFSIFKHIRQNPILILCLTFAILFGFAVGVTTYNFGSLVRYKIPMMPFLVVSLLILYHKTKMPSNSHG